MHLACVVKELIPEQIAQFQPKYWGSDELYLDKDMSFYKALGAGEVVKKGLRALGSKAVRQHNKRSKAYLAKIGGDSNLKGEGMIMGGLYIVRAGSGGVALQYNESTFGDIAAVDNVIAAAQQAAQESEGGEESKESKLPLEEGVPPEPVEPEPEPEPVPEPKGATGPAEADGVVLTESVVAVAAAAVPGGVEFQEAPAEPTAQASSTSSSNVDRLAAWARLHKSNMSKQQQSSTDAAQSQSEAELEPEPELEAAAEPEPVVKQPPPAAAAAAAEPAPEPESESA